MKLLKKLNKYWIVIFIFIVLLGMYLRFFRIESFQEFGWDQARDAWKTRDIIKGQIVLNGPRTGIGHMELGPLWYYLLAPFYYFSNLDPTGAIYLNFFVNIFNFISIFWVTKKIFDNRAGLFVSFFYAMNNYLIQINRVAWNVSPVPGVATLLFYAIYKVVYEKKYQWIFLVSFLTGLFFHIHFSFVFLPFIIFFSFLLVKDKVKTILYSLASFPLFIIWFVPTFFYEIQSKSSNLNSLNHFFSDYLIKGFHLRFFLYRLYDSFIQFQTVLALPKISRYLVLIVPLIYFLLLFFEKDKKQKIIGYLIMPWFIVPSIIYSFYGGSTSEYYMLMTAVLVIYIIWYFFVKVIQLKIKMLTYSVVVLLFVFFYFQTKGEWIKEEKKNSLKYQKMNVQTRIKENKKINFNEGDINAYLWQIWVEDKK